MFLFFGVVAVTGSYFVQVQELPWQAFVCAVPVGLLASAILVVNNVRDLETDRRAGKRTLAVRLGRPRTRVLYAAMVAVAFLTAPLPWVLGSMTAWLLLPWAAAPLALRLVRVVREQTGRPGPERSPGRYRGAAAAVLPAVLGRDPRQRRHRQLKLALQRRTLRLASPMVSSYGAVGEREVIIASLTDPEGAVGFGEAAPLEPYDGLSTDRVMATLERYAPALERSGGRTGAALLDDCRTIEDLPAAIAAVDIALWDLAGRRAGTPVAALLTDRPASSVPVNATITAVERARAAEQASRAVQDGFTCLKLKVGVGDDAGRVAAVRAAAGPHAALRLDANGAWDVPEAVRMIDALAPAGLELVEEPAHGLERVRAIRESVAVRIAIDETAAQPGALGAGVADAVCLKLSRCGGISGLLAAAALVRSTGAEVYVASTLDGPLGIAAGLHAAAALASRGPVPHCGLATLSLFSDLEDPLPVRAGTIFVPERPGLGIEPF